MKGYVRGAHASLWFYKYESKVIMILCYLLFRNVIAECLPNEYKHLIRFPYSPVDEVDNKPKMSIDELKGNPTLSTLIDQLGLEVAK